MKNLAPIVNAQIARFEAQQRILTPPPEPLARRAILRPVAGLHIREGARK